MGFYIRPGRALCILSGDRVGSAEKAEVCTYVSLYNPGPGGGQCAVGSGAMESGDIRVDHDRSISCCIEAPRCGPQLGSASGRGCRGVSLEWADTEFY